VKALVTGATGFPSKDVARLLVERGIDVPGKDPSAIRHGLGLDQAQ